MQVLWMVDNIQGHIEAEWVKFMDREGNIQPFDTHNLTTYLRHKSGGSSVESSEIDVYINLSNRNSGLKYILSPKSQKGGSIHAWTSRDT